MVKVLGWMRFISNIVVTKASIGLLLVIVVGTKLLIGYNYLCRGRPKRPLPCSLFKVWLRGL